MIEILKINILGTPREIHQVSITENEREWASYAGILRHQEATQSRRRRRDETIASIDDNIIGAIGEFVVSIAINVSWRGPGSFRADDLVGGYQVRTTLNPKGRLIIHKKDQDDLPFFFAQGTKDPLVWHVHGWIWGREGKQKIFWDNPGNNLPSFYVDRTFLHPIGELEK